MIVQLAAPVTTRWERRGECTHCGWCCEYLAEPAVMRFQGQSDEYDARYLELRGAQMNGHRAGEARVHVRLPCSAFDAAAQRCSIYERRPRTCQDFPWRPEQVAGTPCSFWFERLVNGRAEVVAGNGAPAEVRTLA